MNESNPPDAARLSRRRLLRGLFGAGAATAAVGIASADPAEAAAGDPLVLGTTNTGDAVTVVEVSNNGSPDSALLGRNTSYVLPTTGGSPAAGLRGHGFTGVAGLGAFQGVIGQTNSEQVDFGGAGVVGWATGTGAGGGFQSNVGPTVIAMSADGVTLRLMPANHAGPPTAVATGRTSYSLGSFSVDDQGDVWLCVASGDPGTWTRLVREDSVPAPDTSGRTVPITPIRVLDTRAAGGRPAGAPVVPGQKKGPLKGGTGVTLDLAGIGPIPGTASAVVGNLTVTSPSFNGYLTARPSGSTTVTSTVNFTTGATVANAFTSKLGPAGLDVTASGSSVVHYELVVDITAYIT